MGAAFRVFLLVSIAAIGVVVFILEIYNQLVVATVNLDKVWADVDAALKQRFDDISPLVALCEGHIKHEREILEKVTWARAAFLTAASPRQAAQADSRLGQALKTLFAVSENYPQLTANEHFTQLRKRVSDLENQITERREFYNESAAIYNTRIQRLPDAFLAKILRYQPREMFAAAETEKTNNVL